MEIPRYNNDARYKIEACMWTDEATKGGKEANKKQGGTHCL